MRKLFYIVVAAVVIGVTFVACSGENSRIGVENPIIVVTGITISQISATLSVGDTIRIAATVKPENATNKNVVWSSNNRAVATVSSAGVVTAVDIGTATIITTTEDGGKTTTCVVTVTPVDIPVTGVTISQISATLSVGDTIRIATTVKPENATNKNVAWSSNNNAVATVSSAGVVTAVATGTAAITTTTEDGGKTTTCVITVTSAGIPVTSVSINPTAWLLVGMGMYLAPTVLPDNATNKTVTCSSSNTEVLTVNNIRDNGWNYWMATAVSLGTAIITITTQNGGKTATCTVTVSNITIPHMRLGNITWASVNIDSYQTFAERPDMYTSLYQWNRSTALSAYTPPNGVAIEEWEASITDPVWTFNPCPTGWRLPTQEEFQELHNAGTSWAYANERGNSVAGRFYGPNHATCSLATYTMDGCMFIPTSGYRENRNGRLERQDGNGYYWSSTEGTNLLGRSFYFNREFNAPDGNHNKAHGFCIRCVQDRSN